MTAALHRLQVRDKLAEGAAGGTTIRDYDPAAVRLAAARRGKQGDDQARVASWQHAASRIGRSTCRTASYTAEKIAYTGIMRQGTGPDDEAGCMRRSPTHVLLSWPRPQLLSVACSPAMGLGGVAGTGGKRRHTECKQQQQLPLLRVQKLARQEALDAEAAGVEALAEAFIAEVPSEGDAEGGGSEDDEGAAQRGGSGGDADVEHERLQVGLSVGQGPLLAWCSLNTLSSSF